MNSEVALSTLLPGDRGTIIRITTSAPAVRQRLLELGLVKGTPVELVRFAPMGDPIELKIRGYRLSIRREEAESVLVRRDAS